MLRRQRGGVEKGWIQQLCGKGRELDRHVDAVLGRESCGESRGVGRGEGWRTGLAGRDLVSKGSERGEAQSRPILRALTEMELTSMGRNREC